MNTVYTLVESDDPKALAEFALTWNDLLEMETAPVVEDQELSEVFKRAGNQLDPLPTL